MPGRHRAPGLPCQVSHARPGHASRKGWPPPARSAAPGQVSRPRSGQPPPARSAAPPQARSVTPDQATPAARAGRPRSGQPPPARSAAPGQVSRPAPGQPQGLALLYTNVCTALGATLAKRFVYSRASPCGWPGAAGVVRLVWHGDLGALAWCAWPDLAWGFGRSGVVWRVVEGAVGRG
jgi:hypothetical protein